MKTFLVLTLISVVLQTLQGFEFEDKQKNFDGLLTTSQLLEWGYDEETTINLDLSGKSITEIMPGAFHSFLNLQTLNLDDNNIEKVYANTFIGLTSLKLLKFSNNKIKTIEVGSFSGLRNLDELDFIYNKIDSLKPGQFQGLNSLRILLLYFNLIDVIEPNTFCDYVPVLWHISLGGNKIKTITADSLKCLMIFRLMKHQS